MVSIGSFTWIDTKSPNPQEKAYNKGHWIRCKTQSRVEHDGLDELIVFILTFEFYIISYIYMNVIM